MLAPAAVGRMVETLEKHPQAGIVHCDPSFVDENGRTVSGVLWSPRWAWGPRVLRTDEPVTPFESVYTLAGLIPSLTLIRRTIYELTPGWDESFGQPCEDTDLFLHVALQSEVRYLPEKLLLHRRHSGQSTTDVAHLDNQEKKLYNKWTHMGGLTLAQREKIAKAEWFVPVPWRQERDSTRENVYCGRANSGLRFDFLSELSAKSSRLHLFEHRSPLRISAQSCEKLTRGFFALEPRQARRIAVHRSVQFS